MHGSANELLIEVHHKMVLWSLLLLRSSASENLAYRIHKFDMVLIDEKFLISNFEYATKASFKDIFCISIESCMDGFIHGWYTLRKTFKRY